MELTRKQVAARLRRSVATVRRLEGHVLHPRRDQQGTHWFSPLEVEQLVGAPYRMKPHSLSRWLRRKVGKAQRAGEVVGPFPESAPPSSDARHLAIIASAVEELIESASPGTAQGWALVPLAALETLASVTATYLGSSQSSRS